VGCRFWEPRVHRGLLERKGCRGYSKARPNRVRASVLVRPPHAFTSVGLVVKQLGSNRRSYALRASSGQGTGHDPFLCQGLGMFVGVAQSVELQFCKLEVKGSSPFASSAPASRFCRVRVRTSIVPNVSSRASEGCPSGQWERAVNPPAYAYGGSNPPPSTKQQAGSRPGHVASRHWRWRARWDGAIGRVPAAGVAQLVERQPSKLNVVGSNPISRSQQSCWRSQGNESQNQREIVC
jgi:hypothetical protein